MKTTTFPLNENETEQYHKFVAEHKSCRQKAGIIGGGYSITFYPTGLGCAVIVKCDICGAKKDITDISCW